MRLSSACRRAAAAWLLSALLSAICILLLAMAPRSGQAVPADVGNTGFDTLLGLGAGLNSILLSAICMLLAMTAFRSVPAAVLAKPVNGGAGTGKGGETHPCRNCPDDDHPAAGAVAEPVSLPAADASSSIWQPLISKGAASNKVRMFTIGFSLIFILALLSLSSREKSLQRLSASCHLWTSHER